jgi:hypothetical protein
MFLDGWVGGWVDGWRMDGKTVLRLAYTNKKSIPGRGLRSSYPKSKCDYLNCRFHSVEESSLGFSRFLFENWNRFERTRHAC